MALTEDTPFDKNRMLRKEALKAFLIFKKNSIP